METDSLSTFAIDSVDWYSEQFIWQSVVKFLKDNGYKIHKNHLNTETAKAGQKILASKFFKKEIIEVKGFPSFYSTPLREAVAKNTQVKNWFTEALFNSFVNFSLYDNAEIAMALPNAGRYQAIIKNLSEYFTVNNLYFKIYLVNKDGTVELSNLNETYLKGEMAAKTG